MSPDSIIPDELSPASKRSVEPLSQVMERFQRVLEDRQPDEPIDISVGEIVAYFGDRGLGALLFVFGAPMCIPLPMIPGVSFAFSLPLLILSGLIISGSSKPWVPKAIASKRFSRAWTAKALAMAIPWLRKVETVSRARAPWMLSDLAYRWSGIVTALMALSIMFPLPFSNFGPAIAIVVMAVGRIMHDGVMILAGAIGGLIYCGILYYTSYAVVMKTIAFGLRLLGFET